MLVLLQLVTTAEALFNETVLLPCVSPKLDPVRVTAIPTGPDEGVILAIVGDWPQVADGTTSVANSTTTFAIFRAAMVPIGSIPNVQLGTRLIRFIDLSSANPENVTFDRNSGTEERTSASKLTIAGNEKFRRLKQTSFSIPVAGPR